jgi:hypothetical protein
MECTHISENLLHLAIATALGIMPAVAGANEIVSIKIEDVGSTVGGAYSPILDGKSGGFRFTTIDPSTYAGTSLWTGDTGTDMLWGGNQNPAGSFTTGFLFGGAPFVPYTFGSNAVGEINIDDATGDPQLVISNLDFGGEFAGAVNFNLPPDPGTLHVNWVIPNDDGTFKVSFQWSHYITSTDDPTFNYVGFSPRWILEGTMTIADSGQPRIEVGITVPDGAQQECSLTNGSFVSLSAGVRLFNGAELANISWFIDGEPAGSGEDINPFLSLGEHAVSAIAETTTGQVSTADTTVQVIDTVAPVVDAAFIDSKSGEPISSIDTDNAQYVMASLEATDVCDPDPVIVGTGGFDLSDGDILKIKGNLNSVMLTTNSLVLRATATDSSGNSTNAEYTLTITE